MYNVMYNVMSNIMLDNALDNTSYKLTRLIGFGAEVFVVSGFSNFEENEGRSSDSMLMSILSTGSEIAARLQVWVGGGGSSLPIIPTP